MGRAAAVTSSEAGVMILLPPLNEAAPAAALLTSFVLLDLRSKGDFSSD